MANKRGKEMDNTHLSLDQAERRGFIHRDYLAHCLRWSHVARYLNQQRRYQTQHVLDVGCGKELPLARLLFSSRMTHTSGSYTGVDINPLNWPSTITQGTKKFRLHLHGKTDFTRAKLERSIYDTIVSFEVMEHVEPYVTWQLLSAIRTRLATDGVAFVSTPCYDARMGAADNHVNEMSYGAFKQVISLAGLTVLQHWGTFASQKDYKASLSPAEAEVFTALSDYYDSNVVACLLAPLHPARARNCLWKLTRTPLPSLTSERKRAVQKLAKDSRWLLEAPGRHSSSGRWVPDVKRILKEVVL